MTLCACGCGGETKIGKKTHVPNKYIFGHHGKGKLLSEEHKLKLLIATKGIPKSEDIKKKISKSKKGKFSGKNHPMWGKHHSEASKIKMSFSHIGKITSSNTRRKLSDSHKGEKAYQWKGGITPLYNKIRNCLEYKEWRIQVFSRDNFICQLCNKKSNGDLNAHHKHKFSDIINENNIKSLSEAFLCNELWNIDNGITLCKQCHEKITVV